MPPNPSPPQPLPTSAILVPETSQLTPHHRPSPLPQVPCKHVNFIRPEDSASPQPEYEFLFSAYSAFLVEQVDIHPNATERNPNRQRAPLALPLATHRKPMHPPHPPNPYPSVAFDPNPISTLSISTPPRHNSTPTAPPGSFCSPLARMT